MALLQYTVALSEGADTSRMSKCTVRLCSIFPRRVLCHRLTTQIPPAITHSHRHPSEYTPHRNSEYNFHNQLPHNISHYQLCTLTCPHHPPTYPPPPNHNISKLLPPTNTHPRSPCTHTTLPTKPNNHPPLRGVIHTSTSSTSATTRTASLPGPPHSKLLVSADSFPYYGLL